MLQSCFLPMQISSFEQSSLLRESRGWTSKKLMLSGRSHLAGNFLSRSLPNSICYIAMSVRANGIHQIGCRWWWSWWWWWEELLCGGWLLASFLLQSLPVNVPATSHHCPLLASHLPCFCSICCLLTTTNVANLSLTMAPKVAFTGSLLDLKVVGEPYFLLPNYSNKLVSFL